MKKYYLIILCLRIWIMFFHINCCIVCKLQNNVRTNNKARTDDNNSIHLWHLAAMVISFLIWDMPVYFRKSDSVKTKIATIGQPSWKYIHIVITIIVYVDSMMNEDIVKKISRLCLLLVVNNVVRTFWISSTVENLIYATTSFLSFKRVLFKSFENCFSNLFEGCAAAKHFQAWHIDLFCR